MAHKLLCVFCLALLKAGPIARTLSSCWPGLTADNT